MSPPVGSPFVRKLYRILQDGGFPGIISWNVSGTAFSVFSMDQLEQVVLPHYFRGRLDAFHEQLREHGFDRVLVTEASLAVESYQHPMFVRGNPNGLINIVRVQLPRKRTRRKKTAAGATMDISDVVVKTEPDDQDYLATMFAELDASDAGNSMNLKFSLDEERFNVLSWLEEPTVDDSVPLDVEDVAAISELAESMSQDDVDVVLRALSDGDGTGFVNLQSSSCPAPSMHENMLINEFPVDMLHTLLERFSSAVPT